MPRTDGVWVASFGRNEELYTLKSFGFGFSRIVGTWGSGFFREAIRHRGGDVRASHLLPQTDEAPVPGECTAFALGLKLRGRKPPKFQDP